MCEGIANGSGCSVQSSAKSSPSAVTSAVPCGQAFIVTLLFDPLSDLPTTAKQNLPKCRIVHLLIGNVSWV